ncbi:MAG: hypothetical protein K0S63_1318 [Gammaproteobacteria bacterium]|jgi:hypothetical protein|nr:hypothetical protein [Gammaproteobacteria bacterium]
MMNESTPKINDIFSNAEKWLSWLLPLYIVVFLTAYLYADGYAYLEGYLSGFGYGVDEISVSSDKFLAYGFIENYVLIWGLILCLVFSHTLLLGLFFVTNACFVFLEVLANIIWSTAKGINFFITKINMKTKLKFFQKINIWLKQVSETYKNQRKARFKTQDIDAAYQTVWKIISNKIMIISILIGLIAGILFLVPFARLNSALAEGKKNAKAQTEKYNSCLQNPNDISKCNLTVQEIKFHGEIFHGFIVMAGNSKDLLYMQKQGEQLAQAYLIPANEVYVQAVLRVNVSESSAKPKVKLL